MAMSNNGNNKFVAFDLDLYLDLIPNSRKAFLELKSKRIL